MDTWLTNKRRDHILLDNSCLFQLHLPVKYSIKTTSWLGTKYLITGREYSKSK